MFNLSISGNYFRDRVRNRRFLFHCKVGESVACSNFLLDKSAQPESSRAGIIVAMTAIEELMLQEREDDVMNNEVES